MAHMFVSPEDIFVMIRTCYHKWNCDKNRFNDHLNLY